MVAKIVLFPLLPTMSSVHIYSKIMNNPERKKREQEREKSVMRNFKMEVESGFFSNKVKLIQREKPLTDEELALMYKESNEGVS